MKAASARAAEHSSDRKYSGDKRSPLEVALSTPRLDDCLGRKSDASIAKGTDARRAVLSSQGTSSWPPDKLNGNDLVEDKREEDWGPFKGSVGSVVSVTSRLSVPINLDTNVSNLLKHLFQLLENFINEYYIKFPSHILPFQLLPCPQILPEI